jgi:hypothetical protein
MGTGKSGETEGGLVEIQGTRRDTKILARKIGTSGKNMYNKMRDGRSMEDTRRSTENTGRTDVRGPGEIKEHPREKLVDSWKIQEIRAGRFWIETGRYRQIRSR